jgi:hypothetical protein
MELKRKVPPNPNGNPNFRRLWGNLVGESTTVRLPTELHSLFKDLTTAIDSGKIRVTDLENLCIDRQNVERQLAALGIGKPNLEIVPPTENKQGDVFALIAQFEESQSTAWETRAQNKGEFSTGSPRWSKYNEFKLWVKNLVS